jgi:DNA-binding CsgD family transcriptional regulator
MIAERVAAPDGCPLSARQFECIDLLARGYSYRRIAQHAGIRVSTVRTHLQVAYRRLGVHKASDAAIAVLSAGWVDFVETDWGDDRTTAAQSLYVAAFQRYTRDGSAKNRAEMTHMLRAMHFEAGKLPPPQRGHRDDHGRHHGIE